MVGDGVGKVDMRKECRDRMSSMALVASPLFDDGKGGIAKCRYCCVVLCWLDLDEVLHRGSRSMWPSVPWEWVGQRWLCDCGCSVRFGNDSQKRRRQSGGEQITHVEVKCHYRNIHKGFKKGPMSWQITNQGKDLCC